VVTGIGGPPEKIGQYVMVDIHGEGHGSLLVAAA
jgi:hypothetical protein